MIKIVKNPGHISELKGKYLFGYYDKDFGAWMYASIGLKPLIGYVLYKIKF